MSEQAKIVIAAVDQATETIQKIGGQFDSLTGKWGKVVGAIGVGAGITYLTKLVKDSLEAADAMGDLAGSVGVPVETLSRFKLAADVSGASTEVLAKGLKTLSINMFEAATGNEQAARGFSLLGVSVKDANGNLRTSEAVLLDVAEKFEEMEDGVEKTALAAEIFGKKLGPELIPFLNNGKDGLEELARTADALGLSLDAALVQASDRANDNLTILGQVTTGLGNKILREVLPTLEGMTVTMLDAAKNSGLLDTAARGVAAAFNAVVSIGSIVWTTLKSVGTILGSVVAAVQLALQGNFKGAAETLKAGFDDAGQAAKDGAVFIRNLWNNELPKLTEAERKLSQGIAGRANQQKTANDATKAAAAEAKKFAEEKTKLTMKVSEYIQQQRLELSGGAKLTESQKQLLKVGEFLRDNYKKLTEAERDKLREDMRQIDENARLLVSQERLNKALEEFRGAALKAAEAQDKETQKLSEQAAALQTEIDKLGLTKVQQEAVETQRRHNEAATLRETAALMALAGDGYGAEYEALLRRIKALDLVIDRQDELAQKNAMVEAAQESARAWADTAASIERALTDSLVKGFEGGKGILQSIGSYILNFFKTNVAQGIAKALTGAITGGLSSLANAAGLGGLAAGAPAGGNVLGALGNIFSGGIGTLGNMFGIGTAAGNFAGGIGGTIAGIFGEAGIGGTLSAGTTALGAGNIAGALGSFAPYAAAAYGLYRLISGVGTGRDRSPAYQQWSSMTGDLARINPYAPFARNPAGGGDASTSYDAQLRGLISTIGTTASMLGGRANGSIGYGLFTSTSPDGRGAQAVGNVFGADGRVLYEYNQDGPNDTVSQRLASAIPGMILAGLRQSNLPTQISEFLNATAAAGLTQEQLDGLIMAASAANTMAEAVRPLGGVFVQLGDLSVEARNELAALTGGLDQFLGKVQSYVASFYSEEEQQSLTAASIAATLRAAGVDITGLNTKDEFRAMVDFLDLSSESGRQQLAALLNVNQAFASIADYLKVSGLTLEELADRAPEVRALDAVAAATEDQTIAVTDHLSVMSDTLTTVGEQISAAVETSIGALREDLRVGQAAIAASSARTADLLDRWTINGLPATESA